MIPGVGRIPSNWKEITGVFMTRYIWQGRASWVPPQFVVVDAATGGIVSRHGSAAAAKEAALGMNVARTKSVRG
jgi:hypothetical protein